MNRVCRVEDVPLGEGRAVEIDGHRVAVFQTRNGWYALDQRCPHKGGPLTDGIVADGCVTCPLHDRRFDLATGQCHGDDLQVSVYAVEIHDGDVWVEAAATAFDESRTAVAA